jgi:DMSO/TMAO reductase YedYZ molybdopterin-dependent catalytic subunit
MKDPDSEPAENNDRRISRREFLRNSGLLITGTALTSLMLTSACQSDIEETETTASTQTTTLAEGVIYSPDTFRADRIPPGQHEVPVWPVLQEGVVPEIDYPDWTFTISGLVENETVLTYNEFMALPMVKVFSDVHCVTGWTRLNNLWEGISSQEIADLANIKSGAKFVIVKSDYWQYSANFTLDDFLKEDVVFAARHNDLALTAEHGAPVRLVVPRLYFWKSVKWATGIEFTNRDQQGYWESYGYNNHGDPWKEERY